MYEVFGWLMVVWCLLLTIAAVLLAARIKQLQAAIDRLRGIVTAERAAKIISHNEARRRVGLPALTDTEPPANT